VSSEEHMLPSQDPHQVWCSARGTPHQQLPAVLNVQFERRLN